MNSLYRILRIVVVVIVTAAAHRPRAEAAPAPHAPTALGASFDDLLFSAERPFDGRLADLIADAADGRWNSHTLWEAASIASGEPTTRSGAYPPNLAGPAPSDAYSLLRSLHAQFLVGEYHAAAWNPLQSLHTGDFQCTSSTFTFVALAREQGYAVQAAAIDGHLGAVWQTSDATFWIETTQPDGVARLNGEQRSRLNERGRLLTDVELVAAVAFSRGAQLLASGRDSEAVPACLLAALLDPESSAAAANAVIACNRGAIAAAFHDRAAAIRLLDAADAVCADSRQTAVNRAWLAMQP